MASSNTNLPPSSSAAAFDMHKLFKPPPQNPNPSPNASAPFGPFHYPSLPQQQQQPPQPFLYPPYPSPHSAPTTPSPNHGAHLMALLSGPPLETAASLPPSSFSSFAPPLPSAPPAPAPAPARAGSAKLPKGRRLSTGDRALYDVDVRLPGEPQPPQLEVSPITKYVSDPGLVLGRQIAVNRTYICYGLKLGAIRVLNINTALRSLLKGHGQRVTDMAFFAEDVHLLASASSDGRIFIWKINEGPDDSDKPQITEKTIVAIQIETNEQSVHPRVCWHCHKQEILAIGIGNLVLKVDTTKVGKNESFTSEMPLQCSVEKLIDGVQLVGKHEGEVTDLSMSQWMTTRLVSSSRDGTIKIWDDRKAIPLATIRPHDGHPVYSAAFVAAPHRPEHIVLITAGSLNRELKIWVSASSEGWLLPGESESWHCTQTLELRSSSVAQVEDAFFNQVVALPQASLILLANAKKNAIYAVHVDYGPNPVSTRMDYISEFMVTMPILSLTGTTDCLPDGEQVVQVYCVQTQAIQQYTLDLAQCLPPTLEATRLENAPRFSQSFEPPTLSAISHQDASHGTVATEISVGNVLSNSQVSPSSYESTIWSAVSGASESFVIQEPVAFNMESKNYTPAISSVDGNVALMSPRSALNLDMSRRLLAPRGSAESLEQVRLDELASNQGLTDYSIEKRSEDYISVIASAAANPSMGESASALQSSYLSKADNNAPHLITPSEILSGAIASFENTTIVQEQKMGESAIPNIVEHVLESDKFEVTVLDASPSGDLFVENEKPTAETLQPNVVTVNEGSSSKADVSFKDVTQSVDARDSDGIEESLPADTGVELQEMANDISEKLIDSTEAEEELPGSKGRKQKAKQRPASGASSFSASPFNSMDLGNEHVGCSGAIFNDAALSTIYSLQDTVNKMLAAQKEMQKQLSATVALPVTKEGRRIETSLGRSMEKTMKSNVDALWARFQEDGAKREKSERERLQQVTSLLTNSMTKELPAMLEKTLKKEISAIGPVIARTVTPVLEKTISSTVADCFQRSVGDKVVTQLEKSINSKLEPMLGRQIQAQFQSSGKQALQEALRSTLESSVVPAFEKSCKSMFEQVDAAFHKGMSEHSAASQKQFESTHTSLALTLRDAINSVSSITQSLTNDVAEGQRKILALLSSGNQKALNSLAIQQGSDALGGLPVAEVPVDPTKELVRLVSDRKFEEAFTLALQRSDVAIVSWLCSQVDLQGICLMVPLPLSQGVLLALFQQLACDLGKDTSQKLAWMTEVATVINPSDPTIALHVRPIFEQIYQILVHQRSLPTTSPSQATGIRLILHVINAVLISCK